MRSKPLNYYLETKTYLMNFEWKSLIDDVKNKSTYLAPYVGQMETVLHQ